MSEPQLHPQARALLDHYIAEQKKKTSSDSLKLAIGFLVANLSVIGGGGAALFSFVAERAEKEAIAYVKEKEEALNTLNSLVDAQLATLRDKFGTAEERVGELRAQTKGIEQALTTANSRITATSADVDKQLTVAQSRVDDLHKKISEQNTVAMNRHKESMDAFNAIIREAEKGWRDMQDP